MVSSDPEHNHSSIQELNLIGEIVESIKRGTLSEAHLRNYFEHNKILLQNNIDQARAKYKSDTVNQIIKAIFPQYIQNRGPILSNFERYSRAKGQVLEKITLTFGADIPPVVLVPCLGLFSAGGWADVIDGSHHIFVALERLPASFSIEILLTHEISHAISEINRSTVLGGFYNEGFATYVSSVLYPVQTEEAYFFLMDRSQYDSYLAWIDQNREKIYADSGEPFVVLDDIHKLYFTSSFSDYPNIGYVIGFKYLKHLNRGYTLQELRTFGMNESKNRKAFKAFICNSEF